MQLRICPICIETIKYSEDSVETYDKRRGFELFHATCLIAQRKKMREARVRYLALPLWRRVLEFFRVW